MTGAGAIRFASLAEVRRALAALPQADANARAAAEARQGTLTKPPGSLGKLEDLAIWLAGWRGSVRLDRAAALVFAGNHGVCAQGVAVYPPAVTAQMVANFEAGGAAINQLTSCFGADLRVVTLELDRPTEDFTQRPAMSGADCLAALNAGAEAVPEDADVLVLGEMGIGNSTVAAALACGLYGGEAAGWVGPGTGADAEGVARKADAVARGVSRHAAAVSDPLAVLTCLGGREQAAIVGAILAARVRSSPVLLDGFICCAAAAVVGKLAAHGLAHCLAGHCSAEPGHRRLLAAMGLDPLLDLGMRLGEGSGAAVALGVLRAAVACHNGMTTFASAGVDEA